MTPPSQKSATIAASQWPQTSELVGVQFSLAADRDYDLYPQYTIGLHAWFLQQIQQFDPELSAYLHDHESEKPFAITGLSGEFVAHSRALHIQRGQRYSWQVHGFSRRTVAGLATWLQQLPKTLVLKDLPLTIQRVRTVLPATTYAELAAAPWEGNTVSLS
ncbi:hypothetical protein XM38_004990 [Halomicronema hongdechloris C2206]|uniref:CRISPR-associated protein Cas6-like N-terminal domain-containing protein n=1 Tax=Halomicronema hongdechloris C2206 TaxID=1641165 RepID=A0A1Z3HGW9_9CYAN|nr:hypothetical protein [Halomicronema hongdechloris]ASC69572.1 hypothetical protein XM38_004990 [Halomicronema hongdechloris C2206]